MKWLLWVVIIGLGLLWITRGLRSKAATPVRPAAPKPEALSVTHPMTLLACSHCGVHLAGLDAVLDRAERPYCSDAHRRAGPRSVTAGD